MTMEIKQGDKVRIANNAPSEYRYGFNYRLRTQESEVVELDDDGYMAAIVPMCVNDKDLWFQIPTKYLIKVDAEAKEAKFCIGDRVRHIKNDECGVVLDVQPNGVYVGIPYSLQKRFWKNREIELAQPKEQTEAEYTKTKGDTLTFPIVFDLSDSYWDAYTADLAKEIALKVANKYNDPEQAAEYAVRVAKAVVEGLKRKRV